MLAAIARPSLRSVLWLAFFGAILAAWIGLFGMARMSGVDVLGRRTAMNMMPMDGWATLAAMWAIMMAAMMGPTLIPVLRTYEDLMRSADGSHGGWLGLIAGYFTVWAGFAAMIAAMQAGLLAAGVVDALGIATSGWFAAALLVVVGAFQFSTPKQVCHAACHSPMQYFLGNWRSGATGGYRMGVGFGAFCVGCCWGYMALGFVGGTMSLLWMGLATLIMVLEKLPQVGCYVIRPVGGFLIAGGIMLGLHSAGLI